MTARFRDEALARAVHAVLSQPKAVKASGALGEFGRYQQRSGYPIAFEIVLFHGDLCAIYRRPISIRVADDWINLSIDNLCGLHQIIQLTTWRGKQQPFNGPGFIVPAKYQAQVLLCAKYLSIKPIRPWPGG